MDDLKGCDSQRTFVEGSFFVCLFFSRLEDFNIMSCHPSCLNSSFFGEGAGVDEYLFSRRYPVFLLTEHSVAAVWK